jgi:hypothetical protein
MKQKAFEFAQEVDQQIEQLSSEEYHLRRGRSKMLQEELLPISRLGIHFKIPGLDVEVEAFEDNGPADGHISISGFRSEEFDVQVTYIYSYEDSLRRELLLTQGAAPASGKISRDRRNQKIVSTMTGVDPDQHLELLAKEIVERFKKKASMEYNANTDLLIAFDEVRLYGNKDWDKLIAAINTKGGLVGSKFHRVFVLNCAHNEMQRAA